MDIRDCLLIDPGGVIQAAEIMIPPAGRNFAEMIRQIGAYQMVRESNGRGDAVRMEAGRPTLTEGPDLAGEVRQVRKPSIEA